MLKGITLPRLKMIAAMLIFGTIGIFRRFTPLPSGLKAALRGLIGALLLAIIASAGGKRPRLSACRDSLPLLILSGALIGANWVLLFESYSYTSVAVATLCYYMAPIFVVPAAALLLKERLSVRQILCTAVAFIGMALVSGVFTGGISGALGILLGLLAAVCYAAVVLMNRRLSQVPPTEKTIVQLFFAGLCVLPYALLREDLTAVAVTPASAALMAVICVVHTGLSYRLYFDAMGSLRAAETAILSYIDPVVSILLSCLLLGETMDGAAWLGCVLILASALISGLPSRSTSSTK